MRTIVMAINYVVLLSGIVGMFSYVAIIDAEVLLTIDISKSLNRSNFPECFIFGTSSSVYQDEGAANVFDKGPNIGNTFTHDYPEKVKDRSNGMEKDNQCTFLNFTSYEDEQVLIFGESDISFSFSNANIIWRLVGLVSSVAGLSCYALSPSFNRLIGRWKPLKFFLYGVLSLAIFTTMLFANKSSSLSKRHAQLKTYISFAILILISVYSFYYDKALNGKPEILSLVSNAAFALMSLSLSKLIKFGFEIGIFTYFLGCVVVQLWTINWMLIVVAIIFGCPLFVMHSSSDSQQEVHMDPEVGNADQLDVGNGSLVIIDSNLDSQQEVSSEGQVIHCSSDSITEVASSGGGKHVDIIHEANEANSTSVVALYMDNDNKVS